MPGRKTFEKFFGAAPSEVGVRCVITQPCDETLFRSPSSKAAKGLFFKICAGRKYTAITVRNNFLISDCMRLLRETACEEIFLFGPCGSAEKDWPGRIYSPVKSYNMESPSLFLQRPRRIASHEPDKGLLSSILSSALVKPARCATVSSLLCQKGTLFRKLGIEIYDMESSTVFSHSREFGIKSAAVFYASDFRGETGNISPKAKSAIAWARKKAAAVLKGIISDAE